MESYKKLAKNISVFALGNLGSKVVSFLLVPLYTYYLTQGEYGSMDLVMTTVSMLLPVVSASMFEAVIRFVVDKNFNQSEIIANALSITLSGYIIMLLFYPILSYFNFLESNLIYLYIILFIQMMNQLFAQFTRGLGKSKTFALNGVMITFLSGVFNILFLVGFNWGLPGYFFALILAYTLSTIFLIVVSGPLKNVNFSDINTDTMKTLLVYSIPLIPNSMMWWVINGSSRYFINWSVGIEANGLFAVSSRIPSFINIITQVFSQAWQLSAFEEYEEEKDTSFYSNVFEQYMSVLFIVTAGIIWILKPTFSFLFSNEFYSSWQPVPFLILSSVFSAFSGFIGVAYSASKQTKGVFKTSIYGGVISMIFNMIFIPTVGIVGAGISSLISFFFMFLIRYFDTKEILTLDVKWIKLGVTTTLIIIQTLVLFLHLDIRIEMLINFVIMMIILVINRGVFKMISPIFKSIKKFLNNKKAK